MDEKTSLGISKNLEALCAYVLFFISGFILLIIEKDNKFVRFHALQSFATFLLLAAISLVISFVGGIPIIGMFCGILNSIVSLICFVLWILLMYKGYKGEMFKVPVIGDIVYKQINK